MYSQVFQNLKKNKKPKTFLVASILDEGASKVLYQEEHIQHIWIFLKLLELSFQKKGQRN